MSELSKERKRWAMVEDQILAHGIEHGVSYEDLSRILGRSIHACEQRKHKIVTGKVLSRVVVPARKKQARRIRRKPESPDLHIATATPINVYSKTSAFVGFIIGSVGTALALLTLIGGDLL